VSDETTETPTVADDWKSYVDLDGTTVLQHVKAPTTIAELLEQRGMHRAQIVQTADGTDHHLIAELIGEAWQLADFAARSELVPRIQQDEALAQIEVVWGPSDFALRCTECGKLLEGRWATLVDIVETARACSTGHE
jgi:hypothetical protein